MGWERLEKAINECIECSLHQSRTNTVIGNGDKNAKLMIIGEGPGFNEDIKGEPFVGKAGQLFDRILEAVELHREEVYVTNIVKCRPPNNRDPSFEEKNKCLPYLREQLKMVNPKIILCLGRIAAQTIIEPDFKITKQHGIWFEKKGYHFIATYHPAALLRDPSKKRATWEDMKKVVSKIEELAIN